MILCRGGGREEEGGEGLTAAGSNEDFLQKIERFLVKILQIARSRLKLFWLPTHIPWTPFLDMPHVEQVVSTYALS